MAGRRRVWSRFRQKRTAIKSWAAFARARASASWRGRSISAAARARRVASSSVGAEKRDIGGRRCFFTFAIRQARAADQRGEKRARRGGGDTAIDGDGRGARRRFGGGFEKRLQRAPQTGERFESRFFAAPRETSATQRGRAAPRTITKSETVAAGFCARGFVGGESALRFDPQNRGE